MGWSGLPASPSRTRRAAPRRTLSTGWRTPVLTQRGPRAVPPSWNALLTTLPLTVMRIGKPLEHLQAAIKTLDVSDPFLKLTAAGRQLGYAAYLFNDMLVWLHTARVRPFTGPTIAKINQRAARFWFWGIVFSLASGTYKQVGLKSRIERLQRGGADEKKVELRAALQ